MSHLDSHITSLETTANKTASKIDLRGNWNPGTQWLSTEVFILAMMKDLTLIFISHTA